MTTEYEVEVRVDQLDQWTAINKWCKESISHWNGEPGDCCYWRWSGYVRSYCFTNEAEAMMFRLKWK